MTAIKTPANPSSPKKIDERLWVKMIQALPVDILRELIEVQPLPTSEEVAKSFIHKFNSGDCVNFNQRLDASVCSETGEQVMLKILATGINKFPVGDALSYFKIAIYSRWPQVVQALLMDKNFPDDKLKKLKLGFYHQYKKHKINAINYLMGFAGGEIIDGLLKNINDANQIDEAGRNLVFYARNPETLQKLLDKKVKIDLKDNNGDSVEVYWSKQTIAINSEQLAQMKQKLAADKLAKNIVTNPQDLLEEKINLTIKKFYGQFTSYNQKNIQAIDINWQELLKIRFDKTIEGKNYSIHPCDLIAGKLLLAEGNPPSYQPPETHREVINSLEQARKIFKMEKRFGVTSPHPKEKRTEEKPSGNSGGSNDGFLFHWLGHGIAMQNTNHHQTNHYFKQNYSNYAKLSPASEGKELSSKQMGREIFQMIQAYAYWKPVINQLMGIEHNARNKHLLGMYLSQNIFKRRPNSLLKKGQSEDKNNLWLWNNENTGLSEPEWRTMWQTVFTHPQLTELWVDFAKTYIRELPPSQEQGLNDHQYRVWVQGWYDEYKRKTAGQSFINKDLIDTIKTNANSWMDQQIPWEVDKETKKWLLRRDRHVQDPELRRLFILGKGNWMKQTIPEAKADKPQRQRL